MTRHMTRHLLCILLLGVPCLGCGKEGPELARVRGKVTYRGEPLVGARVVFSPIDSQLAASGVTDVEGEYELTTREPGDGALVGEHRVMIIARGPDRVVPPPGLNVSTAELANLPGLPRELGKPLIPKKYLDFSTSGLSETVSSGSNVIDFDIPAE